MIMKRILALSIVVFFTSCTPEDATPTAPVTSNPDLSDGTVLKEGVFMGIGGHTANGTVEVLTHDGKKYLVFDPYSSQNGPDLKVYLSKDESASQYIRVGKLMSTMGKQTYEVPGNPDINQYLFVHIWCEAFSVEFARAALQ
jgi:hypothetical protein